ncbi:hypothetical protein [Fuchsiella alkaliacetigena]|uniref:hypothetical protein n=1 Tax=Fuchsiella alkaliacetigena TaxID=957042 RepID=UPI00200ABD30|nr:hypothetical protein [Fuchsiella alkaliacetigena]MCK8825289.1 hypothetical protein [Fuchsiella alkaliacetigena]
MLNKFRSIFSLMNNTILLIALFFFFLFLSTTLVYRFLGSLFVDDHLTEFENELATMIDTQRRAEVEVELAEELLGLRELETETGLALFRYDNLLSRNPFEAQLTKQSTEEELRVEANGEVAGEMTTEIQLQKEIEVLGILGSGINKRAIIEVEDSSYIVSQGDEIAELTIERILTEEVIITKEEQKFNYQLGGEEDQNQN